MTWHIIKRQILQRLQIDLPECHECARQISLRVCVWHCEIFICSSGGVREVLLMQRVYEQQLLYISQRAQCIKPLDL